MSRKKILPSDVIPKFIGKERAVNFSTAYFIRDTWAEIPFTAGLVVSRHYTDLYEDPLAAFEDVIVLFYDITLDIRADSPCLSSVIVGWKWNAQHNWSHVSITCHGLHPVKVVVHFYKTANNRCTLHCVASKKKPVYLLRQSEREETAKLQTRPEEHRCSINSEEAEKTRQRRQFCYDDILKFYTAALMPRVSVCYGLSDRAVKLLLSLTSPNHGKLLSSLQCTQHSTASSNCWFKGDVSFDEHTALSTVLHNSGLEENEDWLLKTEPVDRFIAQKNDFLWDYSNMTNDGVHAWWPDALVRTPYLQSQICDMLVGFGAANLLPPYVLLEIFDWRCDGVPERWSHWVKIKTIERLHRRVRAVLDKRHQSVKLM